MNKKEQLEIKSVISLLNEILTIVQQDLDIDLANQQKLTDIDIELAAQGKALEELQQACTDLGKKVDAILVVLLGPQIQGFTLDQITKEIK